MWLIKNTSAAKQSTNLYSNTKLQSSIFPKQDWGHKQHDKTVSRAESHIQVDPGPYPAGVERIPLSSGETSVAHL